MKFTDKSFAVKFRITFLIICVCFIPFNGAAQLSGTYTIDPAGAAFDTLATPPNFKSFTEAVDSLLSRGVGGPVTINVADGIYTERIQINQIPGASAANTVTIQSQSLDSTKVVLQFQNTTNATNWVLRLNGADYVTIRKMRLYATGTSFARVININGKADHNTIENCQIWGYTTTSWNPYVDDSQGSTGKG